MECPIKAPEGKWLLLEYCARNLNPQTAAELEGHIADCPACREFTSEQACIWAALDEWEAPPATVGFDRALFRIIEAEEQRTGFWGRTVLALCGLGWRPAAGIAIASLLLGGVLLVRSPEPQAPLQATQSQYETYETADLEAIESTLDDLEMLREFDIVMRAELVSWK